MSWRIDLRSRRWRRVRAPPHSTLPAGTNGIVRRNLTSIQCLRHTMHVNRSHMATGKGLACRCTVVRVLRLVSTNPTLLQTPLRLSFARAAFTPRASTHIWQRDGSLLDCCLVRNPSWKGVRCLFITYHTVLAVVALVPGLRMSSAMLLSKYSPALGLDRGTRVSVFKRGFRDIATADDEIDRPGPPPLPPRDMKGQYPLPVSTEADRGTSALPTHAMPRAFRSVAPVAGSSPVFWSSTQFPPRLLSVSFCTSFLG